MSIDDMLTSIFLKKTDVNVNISFVVKMDVNELDF